MSKFLTKSIDVAAILIAATLAIYSPKGFPQIVTPPQFLCNGVWQNTQCGTGTVIPVGQVVQGAGGMLDGIGKCELLGGAAGAVGGAVVGGKDNRGLGIILGGIVGAFAGHKVCESDTPQVGQVAVAQQQRRCAPGKVWAKLNWKGENGQPDHPQHGTMVCMDPNDPHKGS